jgi:protein-tyrosine phosphatase
MIDLHCHILPEVDDGPQSLEDALTMARFFVTDGITHVVATPHCHQFIHLLRADIVPAVERFNACLRELEIPLTVLPGSEIQVTDTAAFRREVESGVICHLGDGQRFTLIEVNWNRELFPPDAADMISWICSRGMIPILAHPERHHYFASEPALLDAMVEAGAWLQVTVDSLLGNHGHAPAVAAPEILRKHRNVVLATDAHNPSRCSGLTAGYNWVQEHLGVARSDDLLQRAEGVRSHLV